MIDLDKLTLNEIEEIEDLTDTPFDELFTAKGKKGRMLKAIGYVVKKREDPDFTYEQAGELPMDFLENLLPEAFKEPETSA